MSLAWALPPGAHYSQPMSKWEYQVAPIPLHNETLMLNNFGEDGWELVHIERNEQGGLIGFLKRPKVG